jgi:hypothetical protein
MDRARFDRAIAAIDAANAEDPNDRELRHSQLATTWVRRLRPDAGEALLLAVRGHHIRRWTIPRSSYPEGRRGYLRWRRDLQRQHAADLERILTTVGYDGATVSRVQDIVQKRQLATDPDVQAFEDALCLVFAEVQLAEFATRVDKDKLEDIIQKTKEKMSPEGRRLLAELTAPGSPPDAPSH